ncbi:MAG: hypothetical protein H7Y32_15875 [Chloroflexales bacterium]|nr:hypothetical protein [Chloroflexales bacterium]
MRLSWLVLLVGALLMAGCGAAEGASAPALAATATVDDVTDPTQGATPIAVATATAAPPPPRATAAPTPTVDDVTDPTQGATPDAAGAGNGALLISMHKTGGIAGVDEYFAVYAGGALELRGKDGVVTRAQAATADLQALQQLLASPDVAALAGRYPDTTADAFNYELELGTAEGKARKIIFSDTSAHPPALDQLLAELVRLRDTAK